MITATLIAKDYMWTFYAGDDDYVFLVNDGNGPGQGSMVSGEAAEEIIREARWLFGRQRVIFRDRDRQWYELIHDRKGTFLGRRRWRGFVPTNADFNNVGE